MYHSHPPAPAAPRFGTHRGIRILHRYYTRTAHRIVEANRTTEHAVFLLICVSNGGGW
jgi:hypothetical protein